MVPLQVLHIASDSNPELVKQLRGIPGAVDQLTALVAGANVPHVQVSASMRLQSAGVLVNVAAFADETDSQIDLSRVVMPLLLEQMRYDPASLEHACALLHTNPRDAKEQKMEVEENGGSAAEGSGGRMETEDPTADPAATAATAAAAVAAESAMQIGTNGPMNGVVGEEKDGARGVSRGENEADVKAAASVEGGAEKEESTEQPDKEGEVRWGWKLSVAEPLKLTAEVMTNVCALAAEELEGDDEEEQEWGSDDEDAMEREACGGGAQKQPAVVGDGRSSSGGAPGSLLERLVDFGALEQTMATLGALLSPTPRDRPPPGTDPKTGLATPPKVPLPAGTAADLADLRSIVALCAANLVQNLPLRALGDDPHVLWRELCRLCQAAVDRAPSCVETLTGVMWGLVRRAGRPVVAGMLAARGCEGVVPRQGTLGEVGVLEDAVMELVVRLCDPEKTRSFEARVNAVGILGALGVALSSSEAETRTTELGLGHALVQALEDPHVLVQAEALNAVMDVYADDSKDDAFRASGAPAALATVVPAFKRKVKEEGKALGRDALCHLKETALNAARFIKYKQTPLRNGGGNR